VEELQALLVVATPVDLSGFASWLEENSFYMYYENAAYWKSHADRSFNKYRLAIRRMLLCECLDIWVAKAEDEAFMSKYFSVEESITWLTKILDNSRIPIEEFVQEVAVVLDKRLPKRNLLIWEGGNNAGKTLVATLFMDALLVTADVQNLDTTDKFCMQNCKGVRAILVNEAMITEPSFEYFKNLAEGKEGTPVAVKYEPDYRMPRTPMILTTNAPIYRFCSPNAAQAHARSIAVRSFFRFWTPMADQDWRGCNKFLNPLCLIPLLEAYDT